MKRYDISSLTSGKYLGEYPGDSPGDAVRAMDRDAGYPDDASALEVLACATWDERMEGLVVTENAPAIATVVLNQHDLEALIAALDLFLAAANNAATAVPEWEESLEQKRETSRHLRHHLSIHLKHLRDGD